jgi:uncharacterized protein (TIGR03032 family)
MLRERDRDLLDAAADKAWRDPAQVVSHWDGAPHPDPVLLQSRVRGSWWDLLAEHRITLLVTREYEHLVLALSLAGGRRRISYLVLPHPSGMAVDEARSLVYVACSRNPNQVVELAPVTGALRRLDRQPASSVDPRALVPIGARFYPGCLYLHELAFVGSQLHATAVGQNAIVTLRDRGFERVWWPRCIDSKSGPVVGRNHLQLNSIAAGEDLASSFFSASTDRIARRRPGDRNFPVDGRGVIFSGGTREVVVRGLTRPHSARLAGGRLWVNNSGYGEVGYADGDHFEPIATLPGWTRGLCFHDGVAFVGTSRILKRFRAYAPGLELADCVCGVHAVEMKSGEVLGAIEWPAGNQIFATVAVPDTFTRGFPFVARKGRSRGVESLFYAFETDYWREKGTP